MSRSAYGVTDIMKMYNLWVLLEPNQKSAQPGPAFWMEAVEGFPTHTASSLYTKWRDLVPTFKDLDR